MGLRAALRLSEAASTVSVPPLRVSSPFSDQSALQTLVWSDLLDVELLPVDRAAAMSVPAMSRSRHLLCGSGASCPLVAIRNDVELVGDAAPVWTYRADGAMSAWHRMLWTIDDLIFSGFSLWSTGRDSEGAVITAARVSRDSWRFAADGKTLEDNNGRPLSALEYALIPGPHEGVLCFAARTLRTAQRLERSAARHAGNPVPSVELRQVLDVELTDDEVKKTVSDWITARRSESGSVAFTPYGLEAHQLGEVPEALLIDGRNASAVDVARHVSIPAAMIDATNAGASLTYETTQGRNRQYIDYGLSLYLDSISARLSMDDITPRGTRIGFKTKELTDPAAAAPLDPATGMD